MKTTMLAHGALRAAAALLGLGAAALAAPAGAAQDFPSRPITLVVGFSPGGSNDILARAIAQPMSRMLGVPVVVENRVGAAATIATNHVARSAPDGYTLMVSSASPVVISPHTNASLSYDALKDFSPVSLVGVTPETLALHPGVKAASLQELRALAASRDVTLASSGSGGLPHLAIELLRSAAPGARIVHVPYKGAGPAVADAMAGHVDGVVVDLPAVYTQIGDGRLRGVAMANDKRSVFLPDLATSGEQQMPGFVAVNWIGLLAPAGTPEAVVARLHETVLKAVEDPSVKKAFEGSAIETSTSGTPGEFRQFIQAEYDKWGKVVKDAGVKAGD